VKRRTRAVRSYNVMLEGKMSSRPWDVGTRGTDEIMEWKLSLGLGRHSRNKDNKKPERRSFKARIHHEELKRQEDKNTVVP
jgi:hypothetical protein